MKQSETTTLSEAISNSCGDSLNVYGILDEADSCATPTQKSYP